MKMVQSDQIISLLIDITRIKILINFSHFRNNNFEWTYETASTQLVVILSSNALETPCIDPSSEIAESPEAAEPVERSAGLSAILDFESEKSQ